MWLMLVKHLTGYHYNVMQDLILIQQHLYCGFVENQRLVHYYYEQKPVKLSSTLS